MAVTSTLPLLLAAIPWLSDLPDPVARVGDVAISRDELAARVAQSRAMDPQRFDAMDAAALRCAAGRALDEMVRREVLVAEAERLGLAVSEADVADAVGDVPEAELRAAGITAAERQRETRRNLLIEALADHARARLHVPDADVLRWLDDHGAARSPEAVGIARRALQVQRWPGARAAWEEVLVEAARVWRWTPAGCR